jgi:hypothetical protein
MFLFSVLKEARNFLKDVDNFKALYPEYVYISIITGTKLPFLKVQGEI